MRIIYCTSKLPRGIWIWRHQGAQIKKTKPRRDVRAVVTVISNPPVPDVRRMTGEDLDTAISIGNELTSLVHLDVYL